MLNFVLLTEKIVVSQIKSHMHNSGISKNLQSSYKSGHSIETDLLYIQNDILSAQDRGELTALSLLDLSETFDTIDHDLLLNRLTEWYGIDGVVLQWVRSYLTVRSQLVEVDGSLSTPQLLLSEALRLYADDTQIYTSFVAEDITQSFIVVQNCMLAIQVWINQSMLKLNPSKTEFMIIGNLTQRKKIAHIVYVNQ